MSIYHLVNGVNQCTFFILPMLGKHPDEYPRFRDCFIKDQRYPEYDYHIHIYTRTGGGNRIEYEAENKELMNHPNYITDFDDNFDNTYASWIFSVPEKWQEDFNKIKSGKLFEISEDYKNEMKKVFPKLSDKFEELFNGKKS